MYLIIQMEVNKLILVKEPLEFELYKHGAIYDKQRMRKKVGNYNRLIN